MGSACGSGHKVAQQDTLILPTRRRTDNAPVASSSHSQLHLQLQTSPPTDDSDSPENSFSRLTSQVDTLVVSVSSLANLITNESRRHEELEKIWAQERAQLLTRIARLEEREHQMHTKLEQQGTDMVQLVSGALQYFTSKSPQTGLFEQFQEQEADVSEHLTALHQEREILEKQVEEVMAQMKIEEHNRDVLASSVDALKHRVISLPSVIKAETGEEQPKPVVRKSALKKVRFDPSESFIPERPASPSSVPPGSPKPEPSTLPSTVPPPTPSESPSEHSQQPQASQTPQPLVEQNREGSPKMQPESPSSAPTPSTSSSSPSPTPSTSQSPPQENQRRWVSKYKANAFRYQGRHGKDLPPLEPISSDAKNDLQQSATAPNAAT